MPEILASSKYVFLSCCCLYLLGGVTLVIICDVKKIRRVRVIFERSYDSRRNLEAEIMDELGDIPDCVSIACQSKHCIDERGTMHYSK